MTANEGIPKLDETGEDPYSIIEASIEIRIQADQLFAFLPDLCRPLQDLLLQVCVEIPQFLILVQDQRVQASVLQNQVNLVSFQQFQGIVTIRGGEAVITIVG